MRVFRGTFFRVALFTVLTAVGAQTTHAATPDWVTAPVVPVLGKRDQARLKARVSAGMALGLREGVFAKVGDSNTEFSPNFYGLACREPAALPARLRPTLARYNRVRIPNPRALPGCFPDTSFSRRSAAAQAGVFSSWSLTTIKDLPDESYWRKPPGCDLESTPLDCEIDATRPRYALVTLGTNDLGMDLAFGSLPGSLIGQRLGGVIRRLLSRGVVPVLTTIPPILRQDPGEQPVFDAGVARTNAGIWKLSRSYRLPLVNLWRAMQAPFMIHRGLADDGLHFSVAGAGRTMIGNTPGPTTLSDSVDFRRKALRYGANRHNLIWLKTLARLDRITR